MIASPLSQSNVISIHDLIDSTFDSPPSLLFNSFDLCQPSDADSEDLPPINCIPRLTRSRSFYHQSTSTSDNASLHQLQSYCNLAQVTLLRSMSDPQVDHSHSHLHFQPNRCRPMLTSSRSDECHFSTQCGVSNASNHQHMPQVDESCLSCSRVDRHLDFDMFVTHRTSSRSSRNDTCNICSVEQIFDETHRPPL